MHSNSVRSSTSSGEFHAKDLDCLANYIVHEEIARGASSVIYRATCKRGRLRNRLVALKKTPIPLLEEISEPDRTTSAALHHTLHHPSIVTLFSEFCTLLDYYQVLELCPRGSLAAALSARRPPVLSEDELRVIVKGLVDALTYMHKQFILHGNLNLHHILLTDDFRPKLSGFSHAVRLPTTNSTALAFPSADAYSAPEVRSRTAYSFSADVWSLGCVMLACFTGDTSHKAFLCGNIPSTLTTEASDLIAQMLQQEPQRRISLQQISSHPFFTATLRPTSSLVFTPNALRQSNDKENEPTPRASKTQKYPSLLSKGAPPRRVPTPTFAVGMRPLAHIQNRDLRRVLSDEVSGSVTSSAAAKRFASAPNASSSGTKTVRFPSSQSTQLGTHSMPATPALTDDTASVSSQEDASCDEHVLKAEVAKKTRVEHPLLFRPSQAETFMPSSQVGGDPRKSQKHAAVYNAGQPLSSQAAYTTTDVAKGTTLTALQTPHGQPGKRSASATTCPPHISPAAISTAYLSPQTHKVAHGQLVVLPSKSLLVDFREGDRRRGKKGNEVLLISPDGATIQVYSAPHLSTPCCLAEPVATYVLTDLPDVHKKAYEDAKRLVNQLKQRVPKLVLYKPDVKCTLMANEPLGDIELAFNAVPAPVRVSSTSTEGPDAQMRVSLRRWRQAVEIARFVPSAREAAVSGAGEWTRKVLSVSVGYLCVSDEDLAALGSVERAGLERLAEFLRICEALEAQEREGQARAPVFAEEHVTAARITRRTGENGTEDERESHKGKFSMQDQVHGRNRTPTLDSARSDSDEDGTLATVATTASVRALPSIELAPRPLKFSTNLLTRPRAASSSSRAPSGYGAGSVVSLPRSCTMPAMLSTGSTTRTMEGGASDARSLVTRFMPSVGWCIRSVSGDSRSHKIMFQDGAILQVDTGGGTEDIWYAETHVDQLVRLSAASAEKTIRKRMEAYEMFVELFGIV